jgi:hypothetical protein
VRVPPASVLDEWEEVTLHDLSETKRRKVDSEVEDEEEQYSEQEEDEVYFGDYVAH